MSLKNFQNREGRAEPERSLVGFMVGGVSYAISINKVREIINPILLTPLPNAPDSVAGVADHRGEVVTVIDLRAHFGVNSDSPRQRQKWILIDRTGGTIGLIVDQVTEVFGTGASPLKPPPTVQGAEQRGLIGVASRDGRLTFVLETSRFGVLIESLRSNQLEPTPQETAGER
jgi:purine-binding chemotaxis protein CheW